MQYNWVFILSLLWFRLSFTVYCLHKHEKQCGQNFAVVIFIYSSSMTANAECRRKFRGLQKPHESKRAMQFIVGFGFYGYCKARANHRQSSLKQDRSYIVYWMWLAVVSNIINHIIQFEAIFCMTSKDNPHCGLNVAAVSNKSI